jgi:hypothetical protein
MNQNEIVHIDHIRDFLSFVQICHSAFLHINKYQTIAKDVGILVIMEFRFMCPHKYQNIKT